MDDADLMVSREAIMAAGQTMHPPFIERLAQFLVNKETRSYAQKALILYDVGIVPELQALAQKPSMPLNVIHQLPNVLERIDAQVAADALLSFLDTKDVNLRLEALRSLNTIQHTLPHLKIQKEKIVDHIIDEVGMYRDTLGVLYMQSQLLPANEPKEVHEAREKLIVLLERRLDGTLERIFRLLGMRYPPEDVIPVYEGIKSVNPDLRMNSVEFLDNLLEPSLKKMLVPIVETAMFETISGETINSLKVKVPDERKCFALLLEGRDPKLKLAVFHLIRTLRKKEYVELVRPFLKSPYDKIREQAEQVVDDLGGE
jgi:AAA family ATP:ADP antiporter